MPNLSDMLSLDPAPRFSRPLTGFRIVVDGVITEDFSPQKGDETELTLTHEERKDKSDLEGRSNDTSSKLQSNCYHDSSFTQPLGYSWCEFDASTGTLKIQKDALKDGDLLHISRTYCKSSVREVVCTTKYIAVLSALVSVSRYWFQEAGQGTRYLVQPGESNYACKESSTLSVTNNGKDFYGVYLEPFWNTSRLRLAIMDGQVLLSIYSILLD